MEPKLILVPTDFSQASTHALRFAGRLAARGGARIRLLYADYFIPPIDFAASAAVQYALTSDSAADEAKRLLNQTAQENLPEAVAFDTRVVIESPVTAIVDEARQCGAGLVVMGTHGRTGFRRLVLGSVTESVMRAISVPLLTVSPLTDMNRVAVDLPRIIVPVDYTPECRGALRFAASLGDPEEARIICVRPAESDTPDVAGREIKRMQAFTPPQLVERCQYKLLPGDHAAEQVVEFAKLVHADLIATGTSTARSTADVMRGSFAERLIERSDCPVLVVNEPAVLRAMVADAEKELSTVN